MAIFSRRTLQCLINENSKILSAEQTLKHIEALNRADESSIGFEWEIALVNAFSKFGKVEYEPDLGGTSRPDIKFDSKREDGLSFVADIATVSDRGVEEHNPAWYFRRELMRLVRKQGVRLNCFAITIGNKEEGTPYDRKIKLKIPARGKFEEVFNDDFKTFLKGIANNPSVPKLFAVRTNSIEVSIAYNPTRTLSYAHYSSYKVPYSLTKNPVYLALKSKGEQLKKSNYDGFMGIFLCDGGSESLNNDGYSRNSYPTKQIIDNFLRQHSSISFVLTFTIKRNPYVFKNLRGKVALFENPTARKKIDFKSTFLANNLHKVFPVPVNDAVGVVDNIDHPSRKIGLSFYGGLTMTENSIKISARALLELLAGKIDQDKFFEDYKSFASEFISNGENFFADKLHKSRLISDIRLEKTEEDDDWIEIHFGSPDPAISKFVVSKEKQQL